MHPRLCVEVLVQVGVAGSEATLEITGEHRWKGQRSSASSPEDKSAVAVGFSPVGIVRVCASVFASSFSLWSKENGPSVSVLVRVWYRGTRRASL